jgi:hypothetical protein
MAVTRSFNFLSQARLDVPHFRAIESAICADFDVLAGLSLAGDKALVLRGFVLSGVASGAPAIGLQMVTADGIVWNRQATESGTFLWVPTTQPIEALNPATNARVTGGWTVGTINYVGLSFVRLADDSTIDLVQFIDSSTLLETPKLVPLGKTLDYRVHISVDPFTASPDIAPVAVVTLDSNGFISNLEDARSLMYRLGSGGDAPDKYNFFSGWTRKENFGILDNTIFSGGDKGIGNLKDWMDASMTRTWELGGGEFWYSNTSDRNVNLVTYGAPFGTGEYFTWDLGTQTLAWQGLRFLYENSTSYTIDVADGSISPLLAGEALYVDLDRTGSPGPLVAHKAPLLTLGSGSPFARWVIAWRDGTQVYARGWRYPVGTLFVPATPTSQGVVKISRDYLGADTPGVSGLNDPIAISDRGGTIYTPTGATGLHIFVGTAFPVVTANNGLYIDVGGVTGKAIWARSTTDHSIEGNGRTSGKAGIYASTSFPGAIGLLAENLSGGAQAAVFKNYDTNETINVVPGTGIGLKIDSTSSVVPPVGRFGVHIDTRTGTGVGGATGINVLSGDAPGVVSVCGGSDIAVSGNGGIGVQGIGVLYGTYGESAIGPGVGGINTGSTGAGVWGSALAKGVHGVASDIVGVGVYGENTDNTAGTGASTSIGVKGVCTGTAGTVKRTGVYGEAKTYGVHGKCGATGVAIYGENTGGYLAGQFYGTASSVTMETNGNMRFVGGAPASPATGCNNTLMPLNITKAWGDVSCNGSSSFTVHDGLNISTTVTGHDTYYVRITFTDPMANENYVVTALTTPPPGLGYSAMSTHPIVGVGRRAAGYFDLYFKSDTGATYDYTALPTLHFSFTVVGRQ